MRKNLRPEDLGDLLEQPLVATLATYRRNGDVLLSPVWHEWWDGGFNVATGGREIKSQHIRHDPRASIVVYEHVPPWRGIEVRAHARLEPVGDAVRRIAVRYLGEEDGAAYADAAEEDTAIRLEPGVLRAWDFADQY
jgi:PPOX class probable F420-dependent enzyme